MISALVLFLTISSAPTHENENDEDENDGASRSSLSNGSRCLFVDDMLDLGHFDLRAVPGRVQNIIVPNVTIQVINTPHGTAMASIVGGQLSGVAKKANIFGIDVVSLSGIEFAPRLEDYLLALVYLRNERMNSPRSSPMVINASQVFIGGDTMIDAQVALLLAAPGRPLTFVAAAGNEGLNTDATKRLAANMSPARVPGVLVVGAANATSDQFFPISNGGARVDIFATGQTLSPKIFKPTWKHEVNDYCCFNPQQSARSAAKYRHQFVV